MSKYQKLWEYFIDKKEDVITLSFKQIEDILGFKIDHSFLSYKKELLTYGLIGYKEYKQKVKYRLIPFIW